LRSLTAVERTNPENNTSMKMSFRTELRNPVI